MTSSWFFLSTLNLITLLSDLVQPFEPMWVPSALPETARGKEALLITQNRKELEVTVNLTTVINSYITSETQKGIQPEKLILLP